MRRGGATHKVQLKFSLILWHSQLGCGHGWHKTTGSWWIWVFTAACYLQNLPTSWGRSGQQGVGRQELLYELVARTMQPERLPAWPRQNACLGFDLQCRGFTWSVVQNLELYSAQEYFNSGSSGSERSLVQIAKKIIPRLLLEKLPGKALSRFILFLSICTALLLLLESVCLLPKENGRQHNMYIQWQITQQVQNLSLL